MIKIGKIIIFLFMFFIAPLSYYTLTYEFNSLQEIRFKVIQADELFKKIKDKDEGLYLIDCRPEEEFNFGHIPTAVNVSFDSYTFGRKTIIKEELEKVKKSIEEEIQFVLIDSEDGEEYMPMSKIYEFMRCMPESKDEEVIFYCRREACTRSPMAARWAMALGYRKVFRYKGSWEDWKMRGYPIEVKKR